MTTTICRRCRSQRDPLLLGALPCEFCGAAPDEHEETELPSDDSWSGDLGRRRYMEKPKMMNLAAAAEIAIAHGWTREAADDVGLALLKEGEDWSSHALAALARRFPGPLPWHQTIRVFVEESGCVLRRIAARLKDAEVLRAVVTLCTRKLGIGLLEGIDALRPLGELVVVLDLPEDTLAAVSPFAVPGQTKSPGWFFARVLFLPAKPIPGLAVGDKVLVEDRCAPDGAGYIPSEEFGLPAGGRVILVPCRRLPTPPRSEELAERLRDVQAIKTKYPPKDFPPSHSFWKTPQGEAVLAQLGEHAYQMRTIMAARKGCARNRLIKAGKEDTTLPDGILAVVED